MSPHLFTASDVERAARLAARNVRDLVKRGGIFDMEKAVADALITITDDSPPYYSEEDVLHILQFVLEKEDVRAEFEDAVTAALRR